VLVLEGAHRIRCGARLAVVALMEITFAGAAGTVTGSKYLVRTSGKTILVDCGLFQGLKELRLRNWSPLPFEPRSVDAVLLTHAHLDHAGCIPLLVRQGFSGHVLCTAAARELCGILLRDSAHLQEEEAFYANRHRFSKHAPALPLYTTQDAEAALERFLGVEPTSVIELGGGTTCRFLPGGHILGASMILLDDGEMSILFSGDLGRFQDPMMRPPTQVRAVDYLVVESTYGDRLHDKSDPAAMLAATIRRTADRHGVVVIPAFCVGRAQEILHFVAELKSAKQIPDIPVYLNSPMAKDTTALYCEYQREHRLPPAQCKAMCSTATIVNSVEASKRLNARTGPMIIIAGSGMATGGRVLHHIKAFGPDPRNTLLFVGYQAMGTRGASLVNGARSVKIHGQEIPIGAEVANLPGLSAHADYSEILGWLRGFAVPPKHTFVTHGEPRAAAALVEKIQKDLGWQASAPEHLAHAKLEPPLQRRHSAFDQPDDADESGCCASEGTGR
jgi:metallo-beta-lactamase family protein